MHPDEFFQIRDFSPNFGYKILDSSHVMLARDVILGGVVQFTMLVLLKKGIFNFRSHHQVTSVMLTIAHGTSRIY